MLPASKYHGCGNDFIILREEDAAGYDLKTLIPAVCDRHTGLGADGFILVRTCPLTMIFYNCDGSRAPMCGNGIRCFAKFCLDEGLVDGECLAVETLAGPKMVTVASRDPFLAQVAMGKADFSPESIGVEHSGSGIGFSGAGRREKNFGGQLFYVHCTYSLVRKRSGGLPNPADRGFDL